MLLEKRGDIIREKGILVHMLSLPVILLCTFICSCYSNWQQKMLKWLFAMDFNGFFLSSSGCRRIWPYHSWWCCICAECRRFRGMFAFPIICQPRVPLSTNNYFLETHGILNFLLFSGFGRRVPDQGGRSWASHRWLVREGALELNWCFTIVFLLVIWFFSKEIYVCGYCTCSKRKLVRVLLNEV